MSSQFIQATVRPAGITPGTGVTPAPDVTPAAEAVPTEIAQSHVAQRVVPGQAIPGQVIPSQVTPHQVIPSQVVSSDAVREDAVLGEVVGEVIGEVAVFGAGGVRYLPFDVPAGTGRIEVSLTASKALTHVGLGMFDQRGPGWQSPGFRGISGLERSACFVSEHAATPGFVPGPVEPGRWTVIVPVFVAPLPARLRVQVRLLAGDPPAAEPPAARPAPVASRPATTAPRPAAAPSQAPARPSGPGWYKGDLHCHTVHSSDAWSSGTALDAAGWAATCRAAGLDFAALTDHNTVAQNLDLAARDPEGVLLLGGEEVTSYAHGHAIAIGLPPGAWLDWRQAPAGLPLPQYGARVSQMIRSARDLGAYLTVAHPFIGPMLSWHFLADALADPLARPDGLEVWAGPWRRYNEISLRVWDWMLRRGWRVVANGGSDLHGVTNGRGLAAGHTTTVVHADAHTTAELVTALRAGRSYVTATPDGPQPLLAAESGDHAAGIGGTLPCRPGAAVGVRVRTRRAAGLRLLLWSGGRRVLDTGVREHDEDFTITLPGPRHPSYVRAELRTPGWGPGSGAMRALTNPIWLV